MYPAIFLKVDKITQVSKVQMGQKAKSASSEHCSVLIICNNMDGLWGHYANWNMSDRKRQILYDLTYTWNPKIKIL